MREIFIVEAVRTPIGKRDGMLANVQPMELGAAVLKAAVERLGIDLAQVDDVIMGCVTQTSEQGANIARLSALLAGFPVELPATSVNRMCGSSQQAIHFACQAILAGDMDIVIAAGVESMTRVPMGSDLPPQMPPGFPYPVVHQGISAEMMAQKFGLTREQLDEFSYYSHVKAATATRGCHFEREILPLEVTLPDGQKTTVTTDEGIRFHPDLQKMLSLKPVFKEDGVITAGNSSQISDGAAALVLMSGEKVRELGLRPRARVVARAVVGTDPVLMLDGPIPATRKVLAKAGLKLEDIDLFEINEAFASVPLAWAKELGVPAEGLNNGPNDRLNVNGGAIALGHPLGATGARLMTTLLHELERREARYGLQSMCIGFGMATATIIERVSKWS